MGRNDASGEGRTLIIGGVAKNFSDALIGADTAAGTGWLLTPKTMAVGATTARPSRKRALPRAQLPAKA